MKKLVTAFLALLALPLTQTPALASDRATYVTGAVIPVDGGLTRSLL